MSDKALFGVGLELRLHAEGSDGEGETARRVAPKWIQLTPHEGLVEGRDGRKAEIRSAQELIERAEEHAKAYGIRPFLDFDHATYTIFGGGGPAAAWIEGYEVRDDGQIWAQLNWTDRGRRAVESLEYRYISPAWHQRSREPDGKELDVPVVEFLLNPGLVNDPNLRLAALHHQHPHEDKPTMNEKILQALGLATNATEGDALAAINALRERSNPDAGAFVPRADYDAAVHRIEQAEARFAELRDAHHSALVDQVIEDALKRGVITPASAAYHRTVCGTEEGIKAFRECYGTAAPKVPAAVPSKIEGADAPEAHAVTDADRRGAAAAGITLEQWMASKAAVAVNLNGAQR